MYIFCFLIILSVYSVSCQDVVGCGGFIQSSIPIKYEKIEVKLYTKQGGFKSKAECAPNNGYFLLAVYDKGDYILQIDPPEGWTFAPTEIPLVIDGETDPCSKGDDLNFRFVGFSVMGQVGSLGRSQGPFGVSLDLLTTDGILLSTLTTGDQGSFSFPNVLPGKYTVKGRHNTWVFKKDNADITVVDDNVIIENTIVVSGYDVKGHVVSGSEPVQGVSFVLVSKDVKKEDVVGCMEIPEAILKSVQPDKDEEALCSVLSDANGAFIFPSLPSGIYNIVPHYMTHNIAFDISPQKLAFTVNYKSVEFKTAFQVYGFSVQGSVVDHQGNGIDGVKINVFGETYKRESLSQAGGGFVLENITTGEYEFQMSKENFVFDTEKIHISPNTPVLKPIVVKEYQLCGSVVVMHLPAGVLPINRHKVLLQPNNGKSTDIMTTQPDKFGKFCFSVPPGSYRLEVPLVDNEKSSGFLLRPSHHDIIISTNPVVNVDFEQFRAQITGHVDCIENCEDVSVYLTSEQGTEKQYSQVVVNGNRASFTFDKVLPGRYKVTPQHKKWCWSPTNLEVDVKNADVDDLKLVHSGYFLKCSISHNITLDFQLENSKEVVGSFELKKGLNQFCLKAPGTYSLTPKSCYRFGQEMYMYNTNEPRTLTLQVETYQVVVKVKSSKEVSDVKLVVKSSSSKKEEILTPSLLPERENNQFVYEMLFWESLSEELKVTPLSKEILFYPDKQNVFVTDNCPGATAEFLAREGIFIEGQTIPPFPGVSVTITTNGTGNSSPGIIELFTDEQGKYRIGPVHHDVEYEVTAIKDGYHITSHPDLQGSFLVQKLAHLTVKVLTEDGIPMSSVLLSLSGAYKYRNNNLTNEDGVIDFANLGPGQYFLRPMQKEYSFTPGSKMVEISEGEELVENIVGKRVAFSCSGNLASLSGIPESDVEVEAVGLHKCSELHENTVSDSSGNYRLRGLQPGCSYNVHLAKTPSNSHIGRLAPANQLIQVAQQDTNNLNFIVFEKPSHFFLSVQIDTDFEALSHIKVLLYDNENLDSLVHTITPGYLKYVQFPPLKPKTYLVKLQSTLSPSTHDTRATSATVTPDENLTKQHIKLKFEALERKVDMEPTQSVVALPLAVALVFIAYNYDSVLALLLRVNMLVQNMNKAEGADLDGDRDDDVSKLSKKKKR